MSHIKTIEEYVKVVTNDGKIPLEDTIAGRVYLAEKALLEGTITTAKEYINILNGDT